MLTGGAAGLGRHRNESCNQPQISAPPKQLYSRSLPSQQFQALLTLFSKFFSSFPHGTCSLSVSRQYLAFDGIYHRHIRAAFPNNPTRTRSSVHLTKNNLSNGALTLSRGLFQGTWTTFLLSKRPTCVDYNSEKIQFFQIYKVGSNSSSRFARRY